MSLKRSPFSPMWTEQRGTGEGGGFSSPAHLSALIMASSSSCPTDFIFWTKLTKLTTLQTLYFPCKALKGSQLWGCTPLHLGLCASNVVKGLVVALPTEAWTWTMTRDLWGPGQVPLFPLSAHPGLFMRRAECARESYKCVIAVDSGSETEPVSSDATAYFKWGVST